MKAMLSEEYYRSNWERFLKRVPGKNYRNLEEELDRYMKSFVELPTEAQEVLRKMKAQEIAESCKSLVLEELAVIKAIEAGTASFGFTTKAQEVSHMSEYRERFEFNCLQLADFKKKYLQE